MPSKKNKVSSTNKTSKKSAKASKPAAKKALSTKAAAKPVKNKKPAKPAKKALPVKKTAPKKAAPVKKKLTSKPVNKKPAAKPIAKTKAKAPAKKTIPVKKVAVKAPVKNTAKKVEVKKTPVAIQKTNATKPKEVKMPAPKPAPKKEEVAAKVAAVKTPEAPKKVLVEKPVYDVLAISNTIPVKQKHEISASKIASISNSITNPIRKTDSYAVKPEKEPNGKYELEFVVHSSAEMLYEFLSTPSGLSEWFCDDLNIRNGIYTFIWDDQLQQARLLKTVDLQVVRFQWVDKTDGSYFEFKIQRDDLTNDISLIITDFADSVADRESSKLLWNSQVEKLMHVIGSIF